mgnify:CR=1 FL=1
MPEKLQQMDLDTLPVGILHDVYMHCSYADRPDRHRVKAAINVIVRNKMLQNGLTDAPPLSQIFTTFGLMLVYWTEAGDAVQTGLPTATTLDGFPTRAELVSRYHEHSGRDLSSIGFYVALGYWKLACILQGVLVRYRAGAMGDQAGDAGGFTDQVAALGRAGMAALDGEIGALGG